MAIVRTFAYVRPPARGDGVAFSHARIEEAPDDEGSPGTWTEIDLIDLVELDPSDDRDPSSPRHRTLTTGLAVLEAGWYRIGWVDVDEAVVYSELFPVAQVTVQSVARLIRARTVAGGTEQGTFNDDTVPTGSEVDALIRKAAIDVDGRLARWVPDNFIGRRNQVVELRTAVFIEYSYFPDQAGDREQSPATNFIALAEAELAALRYAIDPPRLV